MVPMLAAMEPKALVFSTTNLRKDWTKACAACGLGVIMEVPGKKYYPRYKGLTLHDLRRSAQSATCWNARNNHHGVLVAGKPAACLTGMQWRTLRIFQPRCGVGNIQQKTSAQNIGYSLVNQCSAYYRANRVSS
jgi:hypothetical protein